MRVGDWIGLGLVGVVLVGGVVFFIKRGQTPQNNQAQIGAPVPVQVQGGQFVQPQLTPGAGSTTGADVIGGINAVTGLARGLFPNGIGGLFQGSNA